MKSYNEFVISLNESFFNKLEKNIIIYHVIKKLIYDYCKSLNILFQIGPPKFKNDKTTILVGFNKKDHITEIENLIKDSFGVECEIVKRFNINYYMPMKNLYSLPSDGLDYKLILIGTTDEIIQGLSINNIELFVKYSEYLTPEKKEKYKELITIGKDFDVFFED